MSDGLLPIGAFSRACLLSIKTLRAYHEAGILVPARVDPRTGYRAYLPDQLNDAAVVRRLRQLDLPLDQVREVVLARDPSVTERVLARHATVMRERLDAVTRIVEDLQAGLAEPMAHTPVLLRDLPAAHTLAVRGTVSERDFAEFLGQAFGALSAMADRLGIEPSGPSGGLYPPTIVDDDTQPVEAYLPVPAAVALPADRGPVVMSELPAVRVAAVAHAGPYDTLDVTYRHLGRWVGTNATPAGLPVRESYLVSYAESDDPEQFRTEVQWPVTPEPLDSPS